MKQARTFLFIALSLPLLPGCSIPVDEDNIHSRIVELEKTVKAAEGLTLYPAASERRDSHISEAIHICKGFQNMYGDEEARERFPIIYKKYIKLCLKAKRL